MTAGTKLTHHKQGKVGTPAGGLCMLQLAQIARQVALCHVSKWSLRSVKARWGLLRRRAKAAYVKGQITGDIKSISDQTQSHGLACRAFHCVFALQCNQIIEALTIQRAIRSTALWRAKGR